MLSDLLDVNRLEAGERITATFGLCDLKPVVEELNEELSARHGQRFRLEIEGMTLGFWSSEGLRRVMDNLLSNAVKYGGSDALVTTRIRRLEDRILISVHNTGSYIPAHEQPLLFQPYHRSPSAQASGQSGWGLGLVLVRGIVESHRGTVQVESHPIEGTTFLIEMPIDARPTTATESLEHPH
jgi:signal transduction histidine kinase